MELWIEGYAATGEYGTAWRVGTFPTDSMDEAIEMLIASDIQWQKDKNFFKRREDSTWSFWGCRFFDNRIDAQRSFG